MLATRPHRRRAFTIVEMIVVVVIVSLLSAIGLSHLQAAQIRARTAQAKAGIRELLNALDVYRVDHNDFPRAQPMIGSDPFGVLADQQLGVLRAPVAYLGGDVFRDPFGQQQMLFRLPFGPNLMNMPPLLNNENESFLYIDYPMYSRLTQVSALEMSAVAIISIGPDREDTYGPLRALPPRAFGPYRVSGLRNTVDIEYDPTNGLTSPGDIVGFTGDIALRRLD